MKQHPIDLLPEHIRARTQAGMIARRYTLAGAVAVGLIIVTATHAHFRVQHSEDQLDVVRAKADEVFETERRALALQEELTDRQSVIERYETVDPPLPMSGLVATITNELPESMTLDSIEFDVRHRRGRGEDEPFRWVYGELSGFAASDQIIAELVDELAAFPVLQDVSLDYSRSRTIRDRSAREFRLSFWIDLKREYRIVHGGGPEGGHHDQQ